MKKQPPKKMTLGIFAVMYGIELNSTADKKAKGYRIHTGTISFPPYFWINESTYDKEYLQPVAP